MPQEKQMKRIKVIGRAAAVALAILCMVGTAHEQSNAVTQSGGQVQVNTTVTASISASCNTPSVTVPPSATIGIGPSFTCTASFNQSTPVNYFIVTDLYFTTTNALTGTGGNIPVANFLLAVDGGAAAACN